jgi:hypothetical protein
MNNEQQELLYEVYGKALLELAFDWLPYTPPNPPLDTIESFINKCKTDPEFSERWGLKIGERELSLEERILIAETNTEIISGFDSHFDTDEDVHKVLDTWNTPTRLITITYNDKTIESYK